MADNAPPNLEAESGLPPTRGLRETLAWFAREFADGFMSGACLFIAIVLVLLLGVAALLLQAFLGLRMFGRAGWFVVKVVLYGAPLAASVSSLVLAHHDHDRHRAWILALVPLLWPMAKLAWEISLAFLGIPEDFFDKTPSRWVKVLKGISVLAFCISLAVLGCLPYTASQLH